MSADSLVPPGWLVEHHCVCGEWHEVAERVTVNGIPVLPCPNAPKDQMWGFGVPNKPQYRIRER